MAVALVTGGGKRVGSAITLHLAKLGYDVVVHYSSSEKGALEIQEAVRALGRRCFLLQSDFRELYAPKEAIAQVRAITGSLDLLVNSASTFPEQDKLRSRHQLNTESEEEWEEALGVNARAPFFLIKYASELLAQSPNGLALNILDLSVESPAVSRAAHTISKRALQAITVLAAATFQEKFRICSLLLGKILPGSGDLESERIEGGWLGVEPVVSEIERLIAEGESGKMYRVV
jgi:NAD(P)-dependent dehydrogenase (short-subunit alcohol dehydrogenase family)